MVPWGGDDIGICSKAWDMEDSSRMKNGDVHNGRFRHALVAVWRVLMCLSAVVGLASIQAADEEGKKEEKEENIEKSKSSSLSDLLNNLKNMKVPESVSKLPEQLKELKDAYIKTAKTVEELQKEVVALRQEVKELRDEQALLKKGVGKKLNNGDGSSLAVPELTADELVLAFVEDSRSAERQFEGRYIKVKGAILGFQTGVKQIVIFLRANTSGSKVSRVKCIFKRDNNFHVEVIASQDRLVSRNDRTTLLTIGQPVTVVGTCIGTTIDVTMVNCHIEGIDAKRKAESK